MRDGTADGKVLRHRLDTQLGNVYMFMPEWNLHDITAHSSDLFLDVLKHRATTSLLDQYMEGADGAPGDYHHIIEMVEEEKLSLINPSRYKNCWTQFYCEESYGESIEIMPALKKEILMNLRKPIEARFIIPRAIGELVLARQVYLLQALNIAVSDILEIGSNHFDQKPRTRKLVHAATAALEKLAVHTTPNKVQFSDLVDSALNQKSASEDYIDLISTEPPVLAYDVNHWFFSRPELLPDGKGRRLPVHTDSYISGAVFDAVHGAVRTAAIWSYISRLLDLMKDSPDKKFRALVLQELSNTCHLEYTRAHTMFRRDIATGLGSKWFKRNSIVRKDGIIRTSLKGDPDPLTATDPQLYYLLQLCQEETKPSKAAEWLQKLEEFGHANPLEKDKLSDREHDSLGDLAVIVSFIQDLCSVEKLPAAKTKKDEQSFVFGYAALERELGDLKSGVDLSDFVIPLENIQCPDMATAALQKLDEYIVENTGTTLGFLYQDLLDECVANIRKQHEQQKAKKAGEDKAAAKNAVPAAPAQDRELTVQHRREKQKTRPAASTYDITPKDTSAQNEKPTEAEQQTFKVKPTTLSVFSTLLSRSSSARGAVTWAAFLSAMTDLGFSVLPKLGSIFKFVPPESFAAKRPLTLHQPHRGSLEGARLLEYSRRLKRTYGWDDKTFAIE